MTPARNANGTGWDVKDATVYHQTVLSLAYSSIIGIPSGFRASFSRLDSFPDSAPGGAAFSAGWRCILRRMAPLSAPGGATFSAGVIEGKDIRSMRSMCNNNIAHIIAHRN